MRAAYTIRMVVSITLLLATAVLTYRLDVDMRANRDRHIDLAEVRDIQYGLLNANVWAERLAPIFTKRIEAFDLTAANKDALRPSIQRMVDRMIVQAGDIIQKEIANNKSLGIFGVQIGKMLAPMLNADSLRAYSPQFTDTIISELGKPEAKRAIQQSLKNGFIDLSSITSAQIDVTRYESVLKKYGCSDADACRNLLSKTIADEEPRID